MTTLEVADYVMNEKGGAEVVAVTQLPHPKDHFLFLVMVMTQPGKYVVWYFNSQDKGTFSGHYCTMGTPDENRALAFQNFIGRLRTKTNIAFGEVHA